MFKSSQKGYLLSSALQVQFQSSCLNWKVASCPITPVIPGCVIWTARTGSVRLDGLVSNKPELTFEAYSDTLGRQRKTLTVSLRIQCFVWPKTQP